MTSYAEVRELAATGSTNADLLAASGDLAVPHRAVLVAGAQTAGRGRHGRAWEAPAGTSVLASVLLRDPDPARLGLLSLVVGLGLADALNAQLKWPNDVLLEGRKVCGVLAQAALDGAAPRVVVGFGLNVTQTREQLPVPHATSLALAGFPARSVAQWRETALSALAPRLDAWEQGDDAWLADYRARCVTLGAPVRITLPGGATVEGRAQDVTAGGELVVETPSGVQTFAAGDVTHLRRS